MLRQDPDITVMVDWVLKSNNQSTPPIFILSASVSVFFSLFRLITVVFGKMYQGQYLGSGCTRLLVCLLGSTTPGPPSILGASRRQLDASCRQSLPKDIYGDPPPTNYVIRPWTLCRRASHFAVGNFYVWSLPFLFFPPVSPTRCRDPYKFSQN